MKADSWILNELPELLVQDWRDFNIYSEYDLQVCTYYWIRRHFEKERGERWIVRAQPIITLNDGSRVKPDIAIYSGTTIYDVIELKCHFDQVNESAYRDDFDKLKKLKSKLGLRHAYFLYMYDADRNLGLTTYYKDDWMKNYLTFISANVRLNLNGRLRTGYLKFKGNWDKYWRRNIYE